MDQDFRLKKRQLDLAVFAQNIEGIKEAKKAFEDYIHEQGEDDLPPQTYEQAKKVLAKAQEILENAVNKPQLTQEETDKEMDSSMPKEKKKMSIRSQARNSHFKFMQQSMNARPKLDAMKGYSINLTESKAKAPELSIHRSCPSRLFRSLEDSDDVPPEKKKENSFVVDELEGCLLSLFLHRLTMPLTPAIAKLVAETVQVLKRKSILERSDALEVQTKEEDSDDSEENMDLEEESLRHNGSAQNQDKTPTQNSASTDDKFVVSFASIYRQITPQIPEAVIKKLVRQYPKEFNTAKDEISEWSYLVHWTTRKGKRNHLEDRVSFLPYVNELLGLENYPPITFAAIFDGHDGENASEYASEQLIISIARNANFVNKNYQEALKEGFVNTDKLFQERASKITDRSGSTATVAMIIGDTLYCANVGDTSAILAQGKDKPPLRISCDHKASKPEEKERIRLAGGIVVWFHGFRVNGTIAVSRSIGDAHMANLLVADPFILERKIESDDDFIVIASDGLWDVCTPEQACAVVYEWKEKSASGVSVEGEKLAENAGAALADFAAKNNSADNITVLVLFLKEKGSGPRPDKSEVLMD